jgi:hypothetical protein
MHGVPPCSFYSYPSHPVLSYLLLLSSTLPTDCRGVPIAYLADLCTQSAVLCRAIGSVLVGSFPYAPAPPLHMLLHALLRFGCSLASPGGAVQSRKTSALHGLLILRPIFQNLAIL